MFSPLFCVSRHTLLNTTVCVFVGSSWRRGGDDKREERERPRERERDRERDHEEDKAWRTDKEAPRRTKNETDDDGWTTVRR